MLSIIWCQCIFGFSIRNVKILLFERTLAERFAFGSNAEVSCVLGRFNCVISKNVAAFSRTFCTFSIVKIFFTIAGGFNWLSDAIKNNWQFLVDYKDCVIHLETITYFKSRYKYTAWYFNRMNPQVDRAHVTTVQVKEPTSCLMIPSIWVEISMSEGFI
jgi:hypothetical protein